MRNTRRFISNPILGAIKISSRGVIGVASHFLGRYREFDLCLSKLKYPEGSVIEWGIGLNVALNYNNFIRKMMNNQYDWVWILGDDHVFSPNLLNNLLERDVDVVVPLCLKRSKPYNHVIYDIQEFGFTPLDFNFINGETGLLDISGYGVGNAGMLIKRQVIEQIDAPWFINDGDDREVSRCDLNFCRKLKENNIKLHIDLDRPIGHITHVAVWPVRDDNGYRGMLESTESCFNITGGI